ncbi:expressed unknown protein [Seminavis robusta]|uniref:Uncharacterized protein n=1 Tax=Seminavis robusta TaxID=568900 RepID=A0A9N8HJX7_9STRA|nr:expressed unknown protein [Seminavis robusta]|eukprot:Sro693_g188240.1 n/a (78) ;mRNA; f:14024-14257
MDVIALFFLAPVLTTKATIWGAVVSACGGAKTNDKPTATAVTWEEIDAYNNTIKSHKGGKEETEEPDSEKAESKFVT